MTKTKNVELYGEFWGLSASVLVSFARAGFLLLPRGLGRGAFP